MNDVHAQFAAYFDDERIRPYASLLSQRMEEGHICIDPEEADFGTSREGQTRQIIQELSDLVSTDSQVKKPFVWNNNRFYLQRYFQYESRILTSINLMMKSELQCQSVREQELQSMRDQLLEMTEKETYPAGDPAELYTDWQLVAAVSAYLNNFTIITGGPGTGKTTTVAKVLSLLFLKNQDLNVAIAAPTGKAAVRVGESLKKNRLHLPETIRQKFNNLQPTTLHKLLGYQYDSIYFKHNQNNPLPYDVIVVDEASMIDVAMFSKLITAVKEGSRIIFLGDKNQLASVEAGSLFGDLCRMQNPSNRFSESRTGFINSYLSRSELKIQPDHIAQTKIPLMDHVIELKRSHRFKHNSSIDKLSRAILENTQDTLKEIINNHSFDSGHPVFQPVESAENRVKNVMMLDTEMSDNLFEAFVKGYQSYIQSEKVEDALKEINKLRVLGAVREGPRGIYQINKKIEQVLKDSGVRNSDGSPFTTDKEFYENRPIIVTKNEPDLKLSNGDVGIIRKDKDGFMKVWFETPEGEARKVLPAYITGMETVFAMTIHKSQGSEYNNILMILPEQSDHKLLSAELIYTGVTRAIDNVFLQTGEEVLKTAAMVRVRRASGIIDRINEID